MNGPVKREINAWHQPGDGPNATRWEGVGGGCLMMFVVMLAAPLLVALAIRRFIGGTLPRCGKED
jgi:hypothetical protein